MSGGETTSSDPEVTALVVAYHGDRWLPACIGSLAGASRRPLHLLLVDNSGNTLLDTLDLGAFEAERLATPYPMGFAEANDTALVEARRLQEVVLFLNQDTVSPEGWIDACRACFAANPRLGAVSPLVRTYDDAGWDPSFVACLPQGVHADELYDPGATGATLLVDEVPAPALLVRASVLREVGPFDPIFGSYYEDYDLCRRIRAAGYTVGFARAATVRHFSGSAVTDPERERRRMRQILRNRMIHRVRAEGTNRGRRLLAFALFDLPWRLARGVLRTPSSQPPGVTLGAYADLLPLLGRLLSARRDAQVWQAYLDRIGWTHPAMTPGSAS